MWEMHDGWGWWMMFGWVWMLVVVALVVWGVSALVSGRDGGREGGRTERREGALDILERRYAQGEIDHEEFEERRRRLLSGGG